MDKVDIIFFSAVLLILAARLYQKYLKKNKDKIDSDKKNSPGSMLTLSSKDDDYEPYAKK